MTKDKRKIILEYLYKNQYNTDVNLGDLKPAMVGWTKTDIISTLEWLETKHSFISTIKGENSIWLVGLSNQGVVKTTMDNYTALAYIKLEGENYYKEHYKNATWKELQMKFDVISKPILVLVAILSICWNFYNVATIENLESNLQKKFEQTINKLEEKYRESNKGASGKNSLTVFCGPSRIKSSSGRLVDNK